MKILLAICMSGMLLSCGAPKVSAPKEEKMSEPQKSAEALEYEKQCKQAVDTARKSLAKLEKPGEEKTVASVLEPLNDLLILLGNMAGQSSLLRNVHPDKDVSEVATWCEQEIKKVFTDIGLSRPLYDSVEAVDVSKEDQVTRRMVEHMLRDFRRAGVDKDRGTREKIRALQEELVKIGQEFNLNIRSDVRSIKLDSADELKGLPLDYVEAHAPGPDGKITITTDYPDYIPFITYAENDEKRLALYKEFRNRGWPKNDAVLKKMIETRHQLAEILGYQTWAAYTTEDKMAKTAKVAQDFVDKVSKLAVPRADEDYRELLKRLQKGNPQATAVGDWQKTYVEELVKRDAYAFDSQKLRPYFKYDRVKKGLMEITSKLFDITYKASDAKVWHPDVEAYEILVGDKTVGRFYLDMHPRENKFKHAAAFPMKSGIKGRQLPEAALVCNFPGGGQGSDLMEHGNVVTMFHEFGHLLHHILAGQHRWAAISGISTEWDFVEVPSNTLEEWAWDPASLKQFAKNEKGESIPDELIAKMLKARSFGRGLNTRHQMYYAALALAYYNRDPQGIDTTALTEQLQGKYSNFAYVKDTHMQTSFGHLYGYSATYYSYMWSRVISEDLLSKFKTAGMMSSEVAKLYRQKVLEPGGSKDAADLVRDFLGRDYDFKAFANWVNAR